MYAKDTLMTFGSEKEVGNNYVKFGASLFVPDIIFVIKIIGKTPLWTSWRVILKWTFGHNGGLLL